MFQLCLFSVTSNLGLFETGPQQLDVTYEGIPVPGSPFKVDARPGNDARRVKAYGPGQFTFNTYIFDLPEISLLCCTVDKMSLLLIIRSAKGSNLC